MVRNRPKNITNYLFEFAQNSPDKPIILHPVRITYLEFCQRVEKYADGFQKSGISKGCKTIVLIKPCPDLFIVTFALLRIGATPVMIDPGMGIKAMVKALSNIKANALVGIPKSNLLKYIFTKEFESINIWISTGFKWLWNSQGLKEFRNIDKPSYTIYPFEKEDIAAVFFTSGSTGLAKGVIYKHSMFEAQLQILKEHFQYNPEEIDLCTYPLIGLFSMCLGLSIVLADMDMTKPAKLNPAKLFQNINQYKCSYMFCSPMVLKKLTEYGNEKHIKIPYLKSTMVAGASVSKELLQNFKSIISNKAEIHTPYGATEALPLTDILHNELLELYNKSTALLNGICVGYPLKNIELKIIETSNIAIHNWEKVNELKTEEIGEIVVKGENVSQEYLNNILADEVSKIKEKGIQMLWHRTGDLGKIDKKGRVWFYGRKLQRVEITKKIFYTIPTEAVFNQHPEVNRSALVGIVRNGNNIPVICIQLKTRIVKSKKIVKELSNLAINTELTKEIVNFLFYKKFPVDPRHNAKIYREKLTKWAQKKLK